MANHGAEVQTIEHSIAADAPMVAAVLTALGVPSLLLSNCIGTDVRGAEVRRWLHAHEVATTAKVTGGPDTPEIVLVADDAGTRTWFPYLPSVVDAMASLDFTPMVDAAFANIDCYQLIEAPAVRAIRAARAAGAPLSLNLGGSPLPPRAAAAVRGYPRLFIQTNVDDADHLDASRAAASLLAATGAERIIVTAARHAPGPGLSSGNLPSLSASMPAPSRSRLDNLCDYRNLGGSCSHSQPTDRGSRRSWR